MATPNSPESAGPPRSRSLNRTLAIAIALASIALVSFGLASISSQASAQSTCNGLAVTVDIGAGQLPTDGDDVILGTDGADLIAANAGNDTVCGEGGNDTIWGQLGNDQIFGGSGDDKLRGGDGDDYLSGGDGADDLNGGRGDDTVNGDSGNDAKVRGGTGEDTVDGGAGDDQIVAGNGGTDVVNGGDGNDVLVTGGPRPDTVNGGSGNDTVKGNGGADIVSGEAGDDALFGGAQPDTLDGGSGTDSCNGGVQDDVAVNCEDHINVETINQAAPPTGATFESAYTLTGTDACPVISNFLNVSLFDGAGAAYPDPTLAVTCAADSFTATSNGIPHTPFVQLTPGDLTEQDYEITIPLNPVIASEPTSIGYLDAANTRLGTLGVSINGLPWYGPTEGGFPDPYGDPLNNGIIDDCGGHHFQYHYHAMVMPCFAPDWNDSLPSPIIGYALDGFPVYGPTGCLDSDCTEVVTFQSGFQITGDISTYAFDNVTYVPNQGVEFLDECNGRVQPDGSYGYHATATFPYIIGCFMGEVSLAAGPGGPPGGGPPGGGPPGGGGPGGPPIVAAE